MSAPGSDLLVLTPTFHPEKVGTPHYVTDMVHEMVHQGRRPRVVTNQPYYPAFERFPGYGRHTRRDELDGIPVHRLPTIVPSGGGRLGRIVADANLLLQVVLAVLLGQVRRATDVVAVSPGVPTAVLAGAILRRRGGSLTAVVHDIGFGLAGATGGTLGRAIAGLVRRLEVASLNRADRITVLSPAMGRALRTAGVSTPIDTIPLWPTIDEPGPATVGDARVLYSGNLGRKQGVHLLLDLAEGLQRAGSRARVVIRGDGSERARLVEEARGRGLGHVVFEDFVPIEHLAASLAEARVHVVPQLPAGSEFAVPSKVINVLAVGRPVVVTAHADSPLGVLADECEAVMRVEPGDVPGMVDATHRILTMHPSEYGRLIDAAREWAGRHDRTTAVLRTLGTVGADAHSRDAAVA